MRINTRKEQHASEVTPTSELSLGDLEWAFGGSSTTEERPDPRAKPGDQKHNIKHTTWHHWVDSNTGFRDPEVEDEGDLFLQEDPGRTLETGSMVNPATGEITDYEEMWLDVDAERVNGEERVCVVLRAEDAQKEIRGLVIRIGRYIQGVLRKGESFAVERWVRTENEGDWNLSFREGVLGMPCSTAFRAGDLKVDDTLDTDLVQWKVHEKVVW